MSDCCDNDPVQFSGPIRTGARVGVAVFANYKVSGRKIDYVDVQATDLTITLPDDPEPLQEVTVMALADSTTVVGGENPIATASSVTVVKGLSNTFTFSPNSKAWTRSV